MYDAVVINPDETSTQAAGNTISEAIAAAADVQQNNLFRASSAVNVCSLIRGMAATMVEHRQVMVERPI